MRGLFIFFVAAGQILAFDGPSLLRVHRMQWDGKNSLGSRVPRGVYFLRRHAGGTQLVEKSILLK
ncbi:MAG: hypothetical protein AMJ46_06680 [Latescibacteria bacterium DG_63]|nr:MAG: hypothetical protein AMJ46_06680 [Latescibacteria bacterium DG_63]